MESKAPPMQEEEPTPLKRHPYNWDEVAKRCRRTPDKWIKVFTKDRASLAVAIRQQSVAALREEYGFRYTTRDNTRQRPDPDDPTRTLPATCTLFVKYVPEGDLTKQRKENR